MPEGVTRHEPRPEAAAKSEVRSVAKAFAVIKAFGPGAGELTAAEVAARASLDRGTAFRLLRTLVGLGYVRDVPASRRYRLTLRCLDLGFAALSADDLPTHGAALLREAVPQSADAASLGSLERGEVVYLARVEEGLDRHGVVRRPGTRVGAYATALGQAMLAWMPRDERVEHLSAVQRVKLSERTLTDLDALLERLDAVRLQGYAVSDGENAYGLRTVAAPVLDAAGRPVAGVSLTIAAGRASLPDFVATAAPVALGIAAELSRAVAQSFGAIAAADGHR